MPTSFSIQPADPRHFAALQAIELASFETLRAAGAVSGAAVASSDEDLRRYHQDGLLLAAFTEDREPAGFAGATVLDGWLHIGEMDVHPRWQRQGLGRRLLEALLARGRARRLAGASLTTDRLAPFNARFYASLGFQRVPAGAGPAHLAMLLEQEALRGMNPQRRVAMILVF
ncbi:GNAT family N-acetyltransferase [Comamonas humi]